MKRIKVEIDEFESILINNQYSPRGCLRYTFTTIKAAKEWLKIMGYSFDKNLSELELLDVYSKRIIQNGREFLFNCYLKRI